MKFLFFFFFFDNGSNYGYHFITKESVNEFERQFKRLRENTEKYKTFSVLLKKYIAKIDKDGNENVTAISYKIKLCDNSRFTVTSLSNLVNDLTE